MRKGLGKAQQIRGDKRHRKYKNHLLHRNPRDGKENQGSYDRWIYEQIQKLVDKQTKKEENNA